jgi:hypothetical protein
MPITRTLWNLVGLLALALGIIGIFLPLVPTVPFLILAAFCFARGNPAWEARMLDHPQVGPPIRAWRDHGVIPRRGKIAATIGFAGSIAWGFWLIVWPWSLLPPLVAAISLTWIWTRPDKHTSPS